MRGQPLR
jgi:hypothetical protein